MRELKYCFGKMLGLISSPTSYPSEICEFKIKCKNCLFEHENRKFCYIFALFEYLKSR